MDLELGLFHRLIVLVYRLLGVIYVYPPGAGSGAKKKTDGSSKKEESEDQKASKESEHTKSDNPQESIAAATPQLTLETLPVPCPAGETAASPSESDPAIGWIYRLSKTALQVEMSRYGLDTEGTVEELRKTFKQYLKNPARREKQLEFHRDDYGDNRSDLPRYTEARGGRQENDDPFSVKEMLGLPPHADEAAVKRALSDLLHQGRGLTTREEGDRHPLPRKATQVRQAESKYPPPQDSVEDEEGATATRQFERNHRTNDTITVCNLVRKWSVRFDGRKDPVAFIERLEELMEAYSLNKNDILRALPELLHGTALLWQRNNREMWTTYEEFRKEFELQFWPPGYRRKIDEELRRRTQGEKEPFREFLIAITTLMRRRGELYPHEKIDIIYGNMRPEYKLTIRRDEIRSTHDLTNKAEHYEAYLRDKANFQPPPNPSHALVGDTAYQTRRRAFNAPDTSTVQGTLETPGYNPTHRFEKGGVTNGRKEDSAPVTHRNSNGDSGAGPAMKPKLRDWPICWNCENRGHRFSE